MPFSRTLVSGSRYWDRRVCIRRRANAGQSRSREPQLNADAGLADLMTWCLLTCPPSRPPSHVITRWQNFPNSNPRGLSGASTLRLFVTRQLLMRKLVSTGGYIKAPLEPTQLPQPPKCGSKSSHRAMCKNAYIDL